MTIAAANPTNTSGARPAAGRGPVALATIVTAVLVGIMLLFTAPAASAAPLVRAGNGVGVIHVAAGQRVGPHESIPAGQGRIRAPNYDRTVVGSGVGAETATAAIDTGNVAVYTSTNAAGDVNYVGITNNVARRAAEQLASKGIDITPIDGLENLSRADARSVEQVLIEQNGGPGGGQLLNKINSVAQSNPAYGQSLQRGCAILSAVGYDTGC